MALTTPDIELICSVFVLVLCASAIIALFVKLLAKLRTVIAPYLVKPHDRFLGIISAVALGFYGVGCLISCFALLIFMYAGSAHYDAVRGVVWIFGGSFYLFGQWMLLLTFVLRLDISFTDNPSIRFNTRVVKMCYMVIYSLLILIISIFITVGLEQRMSSVALAVIWSLAHFIASVLMMALFLIKVFDVMRQKLHDEVAKEEINDGENAEHSVTLNVNDVKSATRYALLGGIAVCSSFMTMVIMVIITIEHEHDAYDNAKELGALEYLFVAVDSLVNACCLYFLFEFNAVSYFQLCAFGHSVVEKCCIRCVAAKISAAAVYDDEEENQDYDEIDYEDLILR